ncbi:hypothetical protein CYY_001987 [Polysphondylium violaceum]|uniref:Membrane bound O-acyl transferase family protein n=1 Tax=Polysphondylium violaceum TaxID=133409 RepID=A0A8J4Q078_9MYCE|nr:hypothetical protein CYY_001987 [Polysphondylium violaceum]
MDQILDIIGLFPVDQIKTLACLLTSYPFALIVKRLPSANAKHILNIILGVAYCSFCLGQWSWIHSFASSLVVYGLLMVLPKRFAHLVVFGFCMLYLSISHIYRMMNDYMGWTLDYTGPQMILTLKLTSFAWNLYDGSRPQDQLSGDQKKRSIKKLPSLLEYFGFVYFFPTFLAGPTIEITDYLNFTSGAMFNDERLKGKAPASGFPAFKTFIRAIICFVFVFISGDYAPYYLATDAFRSYTGIFEKIVRVHIHVALSRFKYYFGWYMGEGSAILSGIGFNGFDDKGDAKWDRITNVYPLRVEFASNIREVSTYWNIGTSDWLKRYIYLRLTPPGAKPTFFATFAVYSTSAIWHGFYPGYYVFFIMSTFLTEVAKDMRRKLRPYFVKTIETPTGPQEKGTVLKPLYDIVGLMCTEWFLSFFGTSFLLLSIESTLQIWETFYYLPPIILLLSFFILRYIVPTPRSGSKSKSQ